MRKLERMHTCAFRRWHADGVHRVLLTCRTDRWRRRQSWHTHTPGALGALAIARVEGPDWNGFR